MPRRAAPKKARALAAVMLGGRVTDLDLPEHEHLPNVLSARRYRSARM
ncbi:hypothetical protein [Streptomyces sp. NBC_00076]